MAINAKLRSASVYYVDVNLFDVNDLLCASQYLKKNNLNLSHFTNLGGWIQYDIL